MTSTALLAKSGLNTLAVAAQLAPARLANKPTLYQTLTSTLTALDPAKFVEKDKEALSKNWRKAFGRDLVSDELYDAISAKTGASTQSGSDSREVSVNPKITTYLLHFTNRVLILSAMKLKLLMTSSSIRCPTVNLSYSTVLPGPAG